ncbi:hypothetical protein [Parapedobacter sp.]|uniref:hypothetical protein n=1 Tax=Parapedobacter sp. TaxID=1958893 RepID=UPI002D7E910C|nr:hypothetical protein [Parapedobacter sp.]
MSEVGEKHILLGYIQYDIGCHIVVKDTCFTVMNENNRAIVWDANNNPWGDTLFKEQMEHYRIAFKVQFR